MYFRKVLALYGRRAVMNVVPQKIVCGSTLSLCVMQFYLFM